MRLTLAELEHSLVVALEGLMTAPEEQRWYVDVECVVNQKWFVQFYGSRTTGLFLDLPLQLLADVHRAKILPSPDATSLYAHQWHCNPAGGAAWAVRIFREAFELPDDAELCIGFDAQCDGEPN